MADVASSVASTRTSLPVRWLVSQKFDSIDKIAEIHMPLLIVHGSADQYVSPRFSEELFQAAQEPKNLFLVPGGNHNNSMKLGGKTYSQAIQVLLGEKAPPVHAFNPTPASRKQPG